MVEARDTPTYHGEREMGGEGRNGAVTGMVRSGYEGGCTGAPPRFMSERKYLLEK